MTEGPSSPLDGIDLVVFDKDGTLIDFHAMWEAWVSELAARLGRATGRAIGADLHWAMGMDPLTGHVQPAAPNRRFDHGPVRAISVEVARDSGVADPEAAVTSAWMVPDPVATARPLTNLVELLGSLRAGGRHVAIATADDRAPTEIAAALGIPRGTPPARCSCPQRGRQRSRA